MTPVVTVVIRPACGSLIRLAIWVLRRAASCRATKNKGRRTATEIRQASPSVPVQMSATSLNIALVPAGVSYHQDQADHEAHDGEDANRVQAATPQQNAAL